MVNKQRLIDANALVEKFLSLTLTVTGLRAGKGVLLELLNKYRNGILQLINEQPTVDAAPVVHGRWCFMGTWEECSICGHTISVDDQRTNYCPDCGAKMDADKRNGLNPDIVIIDEPQEAPHG